MREIRRGAVKDEGAARTTLGTRLQAKFVGIGLEDDLSELPSAIAQPANFEG